jgi:hypothetical protein
VAQATASAKMGWPGTLVLAKGQAFFILKKSFLLKNFNSLILELNASQVPVVWTGFK